MDWEVNGTLRERKIVKEMLNVRMLEKSSKRENEGY